MLDLKKISNSFRLPQTDEEKKAAVTASAEAFRACRGCVETSYEDYGYRATAKRGQPTEVVKL